MANIATPASFRLRFRSGTTVAGRLDGRAEVNLRITIRTNKTSEMARDSIDTVRVVASMSPTGSDARMPMLLSGMSRVTSENMCPSPHKNTANQRFSAAHMRIYRRGDPFESQCLAGRNPPSRFGRLSRRSSRNAPYHSRQLFPDKVVNGKTKKSNFRRLKLKPRRRHRARM